ncbi:hypothetical protein CFRS1_v014958 [Colletotrichum fructicola]|nr:hypothetical protein CFRS1_v014958 [Colletotrichum fructicola]
MTNPPTREKVSAEEKKAKDKVRKSGRSAEGKIIQLGETSQVFSTVVYFNPTHDRLEGAVYVPGGQYMPDVNGFVSLSAEPPRKTAHANTAVSQAHDNSVGINGAGCAGEGAIGHIGTPYTARRGERRTEDWPQVDWRMADDSALRNAEECIIKQEMPDGAVADGIHRADTLVGMFGAHGVSEAVESGRRVANGRSGDVSGWETVNAQDTRAPAAPAARAAHAGLSRTQAARVQRFLQQVSLHMRLMPRQERLLPYQAAHQDRWRGSSQRNRRR